MEQKPRHYVILTQDILSDRRLTLADKIVLARITGFESFFESAETTAEALGISERQVKRSKTALESLGYIHEIGNAGRGKIYAASIQEPANNGEIKGTNCHPRGAKLSPQTCQIGTSDVPKWPTINKTINKTITLDKSKGDDESQEPEPEAQQFGSATINELLDDWQDATGFDHHSTRMERYAISGLLRQHGYEATKALISRVKAATCSNDRFAPQIAKPSQLRGKYSKLESLTLWERRNNIAKADEERQAKAERAEIRRLMPTAPAEIMRDYEPTESDEVRKAKAAEIRAKYGFGKKGGQ